MLDFKKKEKTGYTMDIIIIILMETTQWIIVILIPNIRIQVCILKCIMDILETLTVGNGAVVIIVRMKIGRAHV